MTTIVEVAARNHLLKLRGHNSAQEFADRLSSAISSGAVPPRPRASAGTPTATRRVPHRDEEVE
jgi:hypothetical protein